MTEHDPIESIVRKSLHEAAGQIEVSSPDVARLDEPVAASVHRSRARLVVAGVCGLLIVTAVIAALIARSDDGTVKVHAASIAPHGDDREVSPAALPLADADVILFMKVEATESDVAAVRAIVEQSADVHQFAYVDHDTAFDEFAAGLCANPAASLQSITAQDLPESFRIVATDADAATRLVGLLGTQSGVESVSHGHGLARNDPGQGSVSTTTGAQASSGSDGTCSEAGDGLAPPSTVATTTTLPTPTGPSPVDQEAARDAVIQAFTQAYTGSIPLAERRAVMQDSQALAPYLDQARAGHEQLVDTATVTVSDVVFLDRTHASLRYQLTIQGAPQPAAAGLAVLDGGRWKVARQTVCEAIQRAGVTCPSQ